MTLLQPLLDKIKNQQEKKQKDDVRLTYIKFLEATVVIIKDYEHINTIGTNIIKVIEVSINHHNNVLSYDEQEVSF